MEARFPSAKCLAFLLLLTAPKMEGKMRRQTEEEEDSFQTDVKKQLVSGIQEFKRIVETGTNDNAKTGEIAAELEKNAMEIRMKIYANATVPEDRSEEKETIPMPDETETLTLDKLFNLLGFKLFGARKEYGLLSKMQRWTGKMLRLSGEQGIDAEINRYYEDRKKLENKGVTLLRNYQSKLTNAKNILTRLRDLQSTYEDVTGNDFSEFSEWVIDGKSAMDTLKKYHTDDFTRAYKETEKTDYLVKNFQYLPKMEAKSCVGPSCKMSVFDDPEDDDEKIPSEEAIDATVRQAFDSVDADYTHSDVVSWRQKDLVGCAAMKISQLVKELWACIMGKRKAKDSQFRQQKEPVPIYKRQLFTLICATKPVFNVIMGILSCFS